MQKKSYKSISDKSTARLAASPAHLSCRNPANTEISNRGPVSACKLHTRSEKIPGRISNYDQPTKKKNEEEELNKYPLSTNKLLEESSR